MGRGFGRRRGEVVGEGFFVVEIVGFWLGEEGDEGVGGDEVVGFFGRGGYLGTDV